MGVNIVTVSQKFLNEYKNDPGFVSNLGDTTPNLAMSVMENCKIVRQVDINWGYGASASNPINSIVLLSLGVVQFTLPSSQTWANAGFSIGEDHLITWTDAGGGHASVGTVQSMSGSVLIISGMTLPIPASLNGWVNNSTNFRGYSDLTALVYGFGLVDNGETTVDIQSKVSGNDQQYYAQGIGLGGPRSTAFVPMQSKGQYLDWVTGSAKVRYVSSTLVLGFPVVQRFEIEHEFMINPYFIDGELTNLQNNVIPNYLFGSNSLKYVTEYQFLRALNNINTKKEGIYTENLGDIAWFNENFNGFNAEYKINSITYEEQATTNSADGLLIGSKTRVKIEVEALNRVFVVGDNVGVYVSYLPEQSEYTNTTLTNQKANFLYDRAFQISGGSGAVGDDFISAFAVFSPAGNIMNLQFDVEYSPTQKSFLSGKASAQDTYFIIGVELGDNTLTSKLSDRIILLADVELYDESPDIPDLMEVTDLRLHPHNVPITGVSGFSDLVLWNEDGFAAAFEFELNLNQSAFIQTLEFQLVAHNPITGQFFLLDSYSYANIGTAIVSGGVQQLFENTTRGYNLLAGDQFNLVTLTTGAQAAGFQKYSGVFAQKTSWQKWLANAGVDTIFFNAAEPQDNLNFGSSNYANALNGYDIKLGIAAIVDGVSVLNVSGTTSYLSLSPNLITYDYDLDGNITPIWSATIETFHPVTAVNLQGAILGGLNTVMKVTWVNSLGPVTSIATMYAIHRIEETDQPGYAIDEMSSILPQPVPNRVIPNPPALQTTLTIVAGDVVSECLIDGSQIIPGQAYNLSARLNDDSIVGGKITEASVQKDTETSNSKVVE